MGAIVLTFRRGTVDVSKITFTVSRSHETWRSEVEVNIISIHHKLPYTLYTGLIKLHFLIEHWDFFFECRAIIVRTFLASFYPHNNAIHVMESHAIRDLNLTWLILKHMPRTLHIAPLSLVVSWKQWSCWTMLHLGHVVKIVYPASGVWPKAILILATECRHFRLPAAPTGIPSHQESGSTKRVGSFA